MQDLEKLKEIAELGLEEPDSPEPREPEGRGGSNVPLVQGALCLLVLGALLLLQYLALSALRPEGTLQEIQLPAWEEALPQEPTAGPSPSAQPTPSPSPWEGEAALQRI